MKVQKIVCYEFQLWLIYPLILYMLALPQLLHLSSPPPLKSSLLCENQAQTEPWGDFSQNQLRFLTIIQQANNKSSF